MIKEAIDRILAISEPKEMHILGRTFLVSAGKTEEVSNENHTRLESPSLDGLLDYSKRFAGTDAFIYVSSPTCVTLFANKAKSGLNHVAYTAKACINTFPFGNKLSQEEMTIKLRSCFEENEDLRSLLVGISRITSGPVTTSADDGVTQTVTVKTGVSMKDEADVNPVRRLVAYRSFAGISSPKASYLLRVYADKEQGPRFSLFDMEGDAWIAETVSKLKTYCRNRTMDINGEPIIDVY
jgi:hypothetical protein